MINRSFGAHSLSCNNVRLLYHQSERGRLRRRGLIDITITDDNSDNSLTGVEFAVWQLHVYRHTRHPSILALILPSPPREWKA